MTQFQNYLIITAGIGGLITSFLGFFHTINRKNPFGLTHWLAPFGSFVWGDAGILGIFWFLVSLLSFLTKNWYLFLTFISAFWFIRSIGETIYWLNEQFAHRHRNPPHTLIGYKIYKNDSIWFVYQTFWQCISVVSLISLFHFATKI